MPVKDGHFALITVQPRHWWRFLELMGTPAWSREPRYQDHRAMATEYPEEVDALVEPWVAPQSKWDLWSMCRKNKIPFQPIQTARDMLESEHLKVRRYWTRLDHPDAGPLTYDGGPFQMTETPWSLRRPAPRLGEHNPEVYCGRLGLSPRELQDLAAAQII